jgi:hypothetical protein
LRAELLQLRGGLRADRNTRRSESATREGSLISRMNSVCKQLCARRPRRLQPPSNARQLFKQAVALCLATFVCRSASTGNPAVWERTNEGLAASGLNQRHNRRRVCWPPPPPTCLAHDDSIAVLYGVWPVGGRARSRFATTRRTKAAFLRIRTRPRGERPFNPLASVDYLSTPNTRHQTNCRQDGDRARHWACNLREPPHSLTHPSCIRS